MDATICTVSTPMHMRILGLNYELTKTLNPDTKIAWNVAQSSMHVSIKKRQKFFERFKGELGIVGKWPQSRKEIAHAELLLDKEIAEQSDPGGMRDYIPEAVLFDGYQPDELAAKFEEVFGAPFGDNVPLRINKYLASYLHAAGLDLALKNSKTRFSVILDPDFYVVQQNWLQRIIDHMKRNDLAVFGAPWNPRWHHKVRNFPCTHLMVVDHEKVPYESHIMAPDLMGTNPKSAARSVVFLKEVLNDERSTSKGRWIAWKTFLRNIHTLPAEDRRQRMSMGESRDTGFRLLDKAKSDTSIGYECLTPVFDAKVEGFQPDGVLWVQRSPLFEAFYPPEQRYIPPRGTFSRTGFFEAGYPNFRALGWEEFLWEGAPFSFHIRGEMHRTERLGVDPEPAWLGLKAILEQLKLPAPPPMQTLVQQRTLAAS